jgi:hypothetical protein
MTMTAAKCEPDCAAMGRVVDGRYRITRMIGQGGMGTVYEAQHTSLGEHVAVKFPRLDGHDEKERFLREGWAAARLRGENVARILDMGFDDDGCSYIAMELLEGCNLSALIERGPMAVHDAVDLVLQASKGVAEAHARGITHRDLKPSNLFVTSRYDGTPLVKVLDFGLAKMLVNADLAPLTQTLQILGTPNYMPPEQMQSLQTVGPPADVWALGVVIYECLTGAKPFEASSVVEICTRVMTTAPAPVRLARPDVPVALAAVIERCLMKDPARRFPDASALLKALMDVRKAIGDLPSKPVLEAEDSGVRKFSSRDPADGPYRGPAGWPFVAPGVLLAQIGPVRIIYQDARATDADVDQLLNELERWIVDAPEDEKYFWLTHLPVHRQLDADRGRRWTDLMNRHAAKLNKVVAAAAIVASSSTTRGQVQAMTWISPTTYPYAIFATLDEAFVFLKDHVGMDPQTFERRYEQLLASTGMQ